MANFSQNSLTASRHGSLPSSISSSSSSSRAVNVTSKMSSKLLISSVLTRSPSMVGEKRQHAADQKLRRRSEEHTSELQSPDHLVCRLLLEKKKKTNCYT